MIKRSDSVYCQKFIMTELTIIKAFCQNITAWSIKWNNIT